MGMAKKGRLPPALRSCAEILRVELDIEELADKVSQNGEKYHDGRFSEADKEDQENDDPGDQGAPLFVGPGGHNTLSFFRKCFLGR